MLTQLVRYPLEETGAGIARTYLKTGKRLWYGVTKTVLKEGPDRIEELKPLTTKVVTAMRKDGLVR